MPAGGSGPPAAPRAAYHGGGRPVVAPSSRRFLRWCLGYAAGLLAWEGLRHTPVGAWGPFELLDVFALWAYLPLPVLLVWTLARRTWPVAAVLALAAAPVLAAYGPLWLPRGAPTGEPVLRVMTANVRWANEDAAAFLAAVRAAGQPDLIAVQELNPVMAARIARALPSEGYHLALHPQVGSDGLGLLSRLPLEETDPPALGPGACRCQAATVRVRGEAVRVLNAHPHAPVSLGRFDARRRASLVDPEGPEPALAAVLDRVRVADGPVLVLGDLNLADRQPAYRRLAGALVDAYREAGWGLGYTFPERALDVPVPVPLVRIDYVLYRHPGWTTRTAWTGDMRGSDHRYVVAELAAR